jgi:ABC-type transport system substrate-binding protein
VGCGKSAPKVSTLRYVMIEEPPTLDPARLNDVYITELCQNVFEGLVTFDASNRIVPALAEKWEISPDGLTYTFHIRANAAFHNGRAVSAQDLKFCFERALKPDSLSPTAANYLGPIVGSADVLAGKKTDLAGATAPDEKTLVLKIDRPRGYFLGCLTYPCAWAVCKETLPEKANGFNWRSAVGTGPFKMVDYRPGYEVDLEAFDRYWGGKPRVARIERPIQIDPNTAHNMFEAGEVDATLIALADYKGDVANENLKSKLRLLPQANIAYMVMHRRLQPVFKDLRVRRAFAMAIDRPRISEVAYHGACPTAYNFVPPGMPGENPDIKKIPYNPEAARKLLAEAGYPDGKGFPRLTLVYAQKMRELADAAIVIRDNLRENLGIEVDINEREMGTFFLDTANQEKVAFFLTGWIADYLDPQDFLSTLLRTGAPLNHNAYSNPAFDKLCDKADALSDMDKRVPLYQQADQIAMDDVAVFPISFFKQPMLVSPAVKNMESNLMLPMLPHKRTEVVR